MGTLSSVIKVLLILLGVATGGGVLGVISRVILAHGLSNTQILSSGYGLVAILFITFGFYNIVKSFQPIFALRGVLGAVMMGGGIMWVVPLPF